MAALRRGQETSTETMLRVYGRDWFMQNAPGNMRRALAAGVAPKDLNAYRFADERTLVALEAASEAKSK